MNESLMNIESAIIDTIIRALIQCNRYLEVVIDSLGVRDKGVREIEYMQTLRRCSVNQTRRKHLVKIYYL
jgi:hypothetical protein